MATRAGHRGGRIVVPLKTLPRYVPGSGPPPPPISLLPVADSTCYIINKLALPPAATLGKNEQLRLYYTISWTDLPAAKVTIPCTEALRYVSPREVEEWEYGDLLRRDAENRREIAEAAESDAGKGRAQVGRPPKARLQDVSPSPLILGPGDEELISQKRAAGPSLSTPQKRTWGELLQDDYWDELGQETEADDAGDIEPDSVDSATYYSP